MNARHGFRALALSALLLGACGGGSSEAPTLIVVPGAAVRDLEGLPLLQRMVDAPFRTAFNGRRRMTVLPAAGAGGHRLIFIEEVSADGQGGYVCEPISLLDPPLDQEATELFFLQQSTHQEFVYEHRDFRIRDLDLFLQNYRTTVHGVEAEAYGRPAVRLQIERRASDPLKRYVVDVDIASGLILRAVELDPYGWPLVLVEFDEIQFGPPTALAQSAGGNPPLPPRGGASERVDGTTVPESSLQPPPSSPQAGEIAAALELLATRSISAPARPPAGYRLLERAVVADAFGGRWLKHVYGDGAEQLFFAIEFQPSANSLVRAFDPLRDAVDDGIVDTFQHTSWTVAQGVLRDTAIVAIGKSDETELLDMLQSALR